MLRLVHLVLVVSIFRLERVGTTSLCDEEPQLCIHTELKEELSSNGSSVRSLFAVKSGGSSKQR